MAEEEVMADVEEEVMVVEDVSLLHPRFVR